MNTANMSAEIQLYNAMTRNKLNVKEAIEAMDRYANDKDFQKQLDDYYGSELYIADEVFLSGTAAEITPVREIDDRKIGNGNPGRITKIIQKEYKNLVKGVNYPESNYLTKIQIAPK